MNLPRSAVILLITVAVSGFTGCGKRDVIHEAVMNDDLPKVRALLKSNPDLISSRDERDKTPLFYAESKAMVEVLIDKKADVNATNGIGVTPLYWAASCGRSDVVESLVAHGAEVEIKASVHGLVPPLGMLLMIRNTNAARLTELFLAHGAHVNAKEDIGSKTLLHRAASSGLKDAVEVLQAHGAEVNARDYEGVTPLHEAAYHLQTAELLLANKADVNARNKGGETPLHWAIHSRHANVAALLVAHGADVNARDNRGTTPLGQAAASGFKAEAELLLANGADVNLKSYTGKTPLAWAALCGHKDVAELLLANQADASIKDDRGQTALDLARFGGHPGLVELLRRHPAPNEPQGDDAKAASKR